MFKRVYKHYNLLIDICFWVVTCLILKVGLQDLGVLPKPLYPDNLFGDILFFVQRALSFGIKIILPILLLVSRFRDEYAERIWRKTAKTFALAVLLGPWIWLISWQVARALNGGDNWVFGLQIPQIFNYPDFSHLKLSPGIRQLSSFDFVLFVFAQWAPYVFAVIYKWHRWRDKGD